MPQYYYITIARTCYIWKE